MSHRKTLTGILAPRRVLIPYKSASLRSDVDTKERYRASERTLHTPQNRKTFLNLTPCSLQSPRLWHFVLCCDGVATLAEQSAAAVQMSKLLDTAALDYLRRRTLCVLRCKGRKSFLLRQKEKIRNTLMGIPYFWWSVWDVS